MKETFRGNGYVNSLDCGDGFMCIQTSKLSNDMLHKCIVYLNTTVGNKKLYYSKKIYQAVAATQTERI